ncbi:MAG: LamG domain-containing protein [Bacteroidales bacterium]|nr:LamG domain-containing protein [Bacteroidales bacterium]
MSCILKAAVAAIISLSFNDGSAPGVSGQAAFFDGFDSRIVIPASEVQAPQRHFTLDVWVCPIAFPKSPCPVVCRQRNDIPGGWSLWLDAQGKVHFQVECAGEWKEVCSPEGLPLRQWSRLTALFRGGSGLYLAIDGKEVGYLKLELPSVEQSAYDIWIGRTPVRTPSFFENKSIPIYSSFDGAIDELNIYADKDTYKSILKEKFVRPEAPGYDVPGFEERILPSGPDGLAFGSWYIPLKYYKAFDDRWRGSLPDVVVSLGTEQPWKLVFWHGISYAPCFVTEKGNWMCNEFIERSKVTGWGCPESMSDKHADFSSVRIIENTPARTVVVWRNIPVGVNQKIPYQSEETQWGDCSEETYIIYPDGTCVRRMDLWTSTPDAWYEWCQSLQVLHPSQRPEDVLDASRIMSVAAMDGSSREFGWDFEGKARQDESSLQGANIQVTYLKSEWNPYLILEDGNGANEKGESGPRIDRYAGRWSEYSNFPWRNHWPVAQDYVIGRFACAPDAPSHTYTATQYNAPHSLEGNKMTKLMLCGCTRGDAASLLPLAKSWLRAPRITCDGKEVSYDVTQRAYVLEFSPRGPSDLGRDDKGVVISSEVEKSHVFNVQASPEHPANGLCIILKGESETPSALKIDGKEFTDFKAGVKTEWDGPSLILWLPIESEKAFEIEI